VRDGFTKDFASIYIYILPEEHGPPAVALSISFTIFSQTIPRNKDMKSMAPRFLINEQKGEAIGSIGSSQDTRPVRKNPKVH
jgi:hypothetical protein